MKVKEQQSPAEPIIKVLRSEQRKKNTERESKKAEKKEKKEEAFEDDDEGKRPAMTYYWNRREDRCYIKFLKQNAHLWNLSYKERRLNKINLKLSKTIKSRNPTQCHTHHQKMMEKFGSIEGIIAAVEAKLTRLSHIRLEKKEKQLAPTTEEQPPAHGNPVKLQEPQGGNEVRSEPMKKQQNDIEYVYY